MQTDEASVRRFLVEAYPDVETTQAYGYTFFFYRDERVMPFATIANGDSEHDSASNLGREGVYRLNLGVRKETYRSLFEATQDVDYAALDRIMPHPDYAAQSWICVLSPSEETFKRVRTLLSEAHDLARERYQRKQQGES